MKKVILTLSIIATLFSCTTEEMAQSETQDLGFNRMPTFVGEYLNSQTFINGELADTCNKTWSFASTSVNILEDVNCKKTSEGNFTTAYTFDDTTLYLANYSNTGITQVEYPYTEDAEGNLTLTLLTGEFEVTYKLTR